MDTIGLDLHKRESQVCILTDDGEIIERRIVTSRERFTAVLGGRCPTSDPLAMSRTAQTLRRHSLSEYPLRVNTSRTGRPRRSIHEAGPCCLT